MLRLHVPVTGLRGYSYYLLHNTLKKSRLKNGYIIRLSYSYGPPKLARSRTVGEPAGEPASEPAASSATARRARGHSCSQARLNCSPLGPLQVSGGEPFPNDHCDFSMSPRTPRPRNVEDDGAHLRTWRAGWLAQPSPHGVAACALPAGGQLANPAVPSAWTALRMDSARSRGSLGFATAPPQLRAYSAGGLRGLRSAEASQARADKRQHELAAPIRGNMRADTRATCANTSRQALNKPTQPISSCVKPTGRAGKLR